MKPFIGALVVVLVLLIGVASLAGNSEAGPNVAQPEEAPQPIVGIGEAINAGDVEWLVLSAKKHHTLYKSIYGSPPVSTSGQFVRIHFRVENVGAGPVALGPVSLMDGQGRIFGEYVRAFEFVYQGQHCLYTNLNPNLPLECDTVFEVAKDARNLAFVGTDLKNDPTDLALIALGF